MHVAALYMTYVYITMVPQVAQKHTHYWCAQYSDSC